MGKSSFLEQNSLSKIVKFPIVLFTNRITNPLVRAMNKDAACLVKTAVNCPYGNFVTLEIPAEKLKSEQALRLLRSWSYDNWLYYDRRAAKEFVLGNLTEAVMFWCKAFMELEKSDIDDPRLLATLDNLVDVHLALRDIEAAEGFAERNLALNKILFGATNVGVMDCHNKLGKIYYQRQRYADARREIAESERIAKKLGSRSSIDQDISKRITIDFAPPALNQGSTNSISSSVEV